MTTHEPTPTTHPAERFDYEAAADDRALANPRSSRLVWPGLPLMLLATIVVVDVSMLMVASRDRSFAVAEDYKLGDAGWEAKVARREANDATGWIPAVEVHAAAPGLPSGIVIRVADRDGSLVADAAVSAEVFHHGTASERLAVTFEELAPGVYQGFCDLPADGRWGVDLEVVRGEERWIDRTEFFVMRGTGG